ncbi:MAG: lysylphosphatidylglycerol synthase transmembrane domain-containing protein [Candidatus Latescibacterota bacterium]|nr:lysylphosphatidylglycerol synthase transmembrane domain-containing protein [Candidatus Latescibacterota bacterium]
MLAKRLSRILLWSVGLLLLGILVHQVGLSLVYEYITKLGWRIVPVLGIALSWHVSNTFAWQACFDKNDPTKPGFWQLFKTKLSGEAIGNVSPASHVGSELAKAYLLRRRMSVTKGLPSVVVNKTIEVVSGLMFAFTGTLLAFQAFPIDPQVRTGLLIALVVTGAGIGIAVARQRHNTFGWLLDLLKRLKIMFLEKRREKIEETDRNIAAFYRQNPKGFLISLGFHVLSWFLGAFEVYYILGILGKPITFSTAYLLTSLSMIINTAFFFIPSGVGIFEGGHVFLFHLLGLDSGLGLAVGLLRRIRKVFWVVVGFLILIVSARIRAYRAVSVVE